MVSSEERREVAERLRKYAKTVTHSPEYLWAHLEIAVNGWHMGAYVDESYVYDNEVLSRLADLIDPICEDEGTITQDWPDGSATYLHELSCGHTCETIYAGAPAFCPYCGARVVDDDRRGDAL